MQILAACKIAHCIRENRHWRRKVPAHYPGEDVPNQNRNGYPNEHDCNVADTGENCLLSTDKRHRSRWVLAAHRA
jgi:hypothetical protein